MADFYGSNWANTPAEEYLSPSDCTVGNITSYFLKNFGGEEEA
jgi:hypothetical protein